MYKNWYIFVIAALAVFGCKRKGDKLENGFPETVIAPESINLTGDDRLNSVVFLSWFGTDRDGYIEGYEISLDNQNWVYTTNNDSLFKFSLQPGSDTTDVDFYVRAIDNDKQTDPTPAHLIVPLKNTPPVALFDEKAFPEDTVQIVTTFKWAGTDVDGDETIVKAFIKINEGDWYEIDVNKDMISIVPEFVTQAGPVDGFVYYGSEGVPLTEKIQGLKLGDTNRFYVKVVDLADAESEVDTSEVVFVKQKTGDVLYVTGLPGSPTGIYQTALNQVHPSFDLADFARDGGKYQPKFWSPTFDLMLANYDALLFTSDESFFTNPINGRNSVLLEFAAPSIQLYSNAGGKSFVITSFAKNQDITGITSTLPIDSISSATGQAFLVPDSSIYSVQGIDYPELSPTTILFGLSPFYMSADAEEVYKAHQSVQAPWVGPDIVGARRRGQNNNIFQYFFSVQMYKMDTDPNGLPDLFDQILNDDFNW